LCCYGEVLYKATNVKMSDEWAHVQVATEEMNNDDDTNDDNDKL
jgi:hypothetical protein